MLTPRGQSGTDLDYLLCLPYLEAYLDFDFELPFEMTPFLDDLADSRAVEPSGAAVPWSPPDGMSEEVADLLAAWTTRDFNVFE